jgi:four helix bundle suffix protein
MMYLEFVNVGSPSELPAAVPSFTQAVSSGAAYYAGLAGGDRDYLRVRDHVLWDKESKEARFVRRLGCRMPQTFEIYREFVETRPPEVIANIAICLIHQANYLIDQQLKTLEKEFVEQGGLRERMTRVRLANRNNQGRK